MVSQSATRPPVDVAVPHYANSHFDIIASKALASFLAPLLALGLSSG